MNGDRSNNKCSLFGEGFCRTYINHQVLLTSLGCVQEVMARHAEGPP